MSNMGVDREYLAFLDNLFGRDVWSEFIKQNPEDLLEIKRKFEAKKRGLTAKPTEATTQGPPEGMCNSLSSESF
jgi:hypothetical protein